MDQYEELVTGEFRRVLDARHRITLPSELYEKLCPGQEPEEADCVLAKERFGCLSLWSRFVWEQKIEQGIELIRQKIRAGRLEGKLNQTQRFGRLLSTRYCPVRLAARGRLLVPEGFRDFLGVEPNGECMVIGAAVCLEIWQVDAWQEYLKQRMPKFGALFEKLSG